MSRASSTIRHWLQSSNCGKVKFWKSSTEHSARSHLALGAKLCGVKCCQLPSTTGDCQSCIRQVRDRNPFPTSGKWQRKLLAMSRGCGHPPAWRNTDGDGWIFRFYSLISRLGPQNRIQTDMDWNRMEGQPRCCSCDGVRRYPGLILGLSTSANGPGLSPGDCHLVKSPGSWPVRRQHHNCVAHPIQMIIDRRPSSTRTGARNEHMKPFRGDRSSIQLRDWVFPWDASELGHRLSTMRLGKRVMVTLCTST